MKALSKLLVILAIVVAASLAGAVGKRLVGSVLDERQSRKQAELERMIDETMAKVARDINAKAPVMIDADTRLDGAVALPKELRYNYTFVNHDAESVDEPALTSVWGPKLVNKVCTSSDMQAMVRSGITLSYAYYGNDQKEITVFRVPPSACRK